MNGVETKSKESEPPRDLSYENRSRQNILNKVKESRERRKKMQSPVEHSKTSIIDPGPCKAGIEASVVGKTSDQKINNYCFYCQQEEQTYREYFVSTATICDACPAKLYECTINRSDRYGGWGPFLQKAFVLYSDQCEKCLARKKDLGGVDIDC